MSLFDYIVCEVPLPDGFTAIAQWELETETANALAQMATRFASGNTTLASLVRERQDLQTRWKIVDKELTAALSLSPDLRGGADERARKESADIDVRIAAIGERLKVGFPKYAALASPVPLSVAEVQGLLGPDRHWCCSSTCLIGSPRLRRLSSGSSPNQMCAGCALVSARRR